MAFYKHVSQVKLRPGRVTKIQGFSPICLRGIVSSDVECRCGKIVLLPYLLTNIKTKTRNSVQETSIMWLLVLAQCVKHAGGGAGGAGGAGGGRYKIL